MKIFNTLTREKEELIPIEEGKIKMYACGPTVYNFIHIGNARPICIFDVMRRYLEFRGYEVKFVQNFTDIDDKIIRRANEEGVTIKDISERYINEFRIDSDGMGVRPADVHPKVSETMDEIIHIVSTLIEKGHAYESNGDVYFSTKTFDVYGKLSHQNLDDLNSGNREVIHNVNDQKQDPMDFALWKAAKPGEPAWQSPWGMGRPGWHIECTAMINKHLGETIDIHCGGQDLIFPHHENEVAQGECCTGKDYAHYWMHNGYINVDNKKMSKSLGNFFTVRDVAEKYGYEPIKFLMLQAHYRSPINYNIDIIEQCKAALDRLYKCRENLEFAISNASDTIIAEEEEFLKTLEARKARFIEVMDDDLNTADGISTMFDLAKDINTIITKKPSKASLEKARELYNTLADVLGILYADADKNLDEEIEALIEARQQARKNKDFATSDTIRDDLKARGIVLEDTPQGIKWHKE